MEATSEKLTLDEECMQSLVVDALKKIQSNTSLTPEQKELLKKLGKPESIPKSELLIINDMIHNRIPETKGKELGLLGTISFLQLYHHVSMLPTYIQHFKSTQVYDIMRLALDLRFHYPAQSPETLLVELKAFLNKANQPSLNFQYLASAVILAQFQAYDLTEKYLNLLLDAPFENQKPIIHIMVDLIRALIFRRQGRFGEAHWHFSRVCIDLLEYEDIESMLYVLNEWSYVLYRITDLKKASSLLSLVRDNIKDCSCANVAKTLYYLFYITKYEKPRADKIQYMENLLQIQNTILQNNELLHLHFYAGNFYSTIQVNFAESIKHFNESNYYLMKSWEQLLQNNAFLHENLPMDELKLIQPIFELRLKDLLNENSLQINQFVEYLDFAYNEQNKLYEKMQELSLTDSLTGLRNRRYLMNNIPQMMFLARRHQNPISFIMLDIDDFKKINDIYGHVAGDRILRDLSDMIQPMFRKSDIIIRYGGEEILLVLFDAQTDDALRLTEQLRSTVEKKTFAFQDFHIHITISGGISTHFFAEKEKEDIKLEDMIALADHALYYSKKHGKNIITTSEQMANKFLNP